MKFTIVGCGSLGSRVAYYLTLLALEPNIKIEKIVLIDNDILEKKNLPYLFINSTHEHIDSFMSTPKVDLLAEQLLHINPSINIEKIFKNFNDDIEFEGFSFDCMDNASKNKMFDMRGRVDGCFGLIEFKPETTIIKNNNKSCSYNFYASPFYCSVLANIMVNWGINNNFEKNTYHFDLRKPLYFEKGDINV